MAAGAAADAEGEEGEKEAGRDDEEKGEVGVKEGENEIEE